MNFDDDAIAQCDALARLGLNQLRQHRHRLQQAQTVAHDHARLPAVGGDDHDGADLAGAKSGRQSLKHARNTAMTARMKDLPPRRPITSHASCSGLVGAAVRPVYFCRSQAARSSAATRTAPREIPATPPTSVPGRTRQTRWDRRWPEGCSLHRLAMIVCVS